MKLKFISLFSGYGTQELALDYANVDYENVAYCDNYNTAVSAYESLHSSKYGNLGDIRNIKSEDLPNCDFMSYSFPCQDISISGNQKGIKEGTRSGLLFEVERLLQIKTPKYLLMENVKNLISKNHIQNFKNHINFLSSLGYGSHWLLLNGVDFGCPQNRERIYMMSVLGKTNEEVKEIMLRTLKHKTSRIQMRPFLEHNVSEDLFINCEFDSHISKTNSICKMVGRRKDIKYDQGRRIYSPDGCSPCLTTSGSPQILTDDGRVRKITAREAYRFMGVRDSDIDKLLSTKISTQTHVSLAGNSICVPVMVAIFKEFFVDYMVKYRRNLLLTENNNN